MAQLVFKDDFAGSLAFDTDGDGTRESLAKLDILRDAVLRKCDANDGIKDGVIDNPPGCAFDPEADLQRWACPNNVNGDKCFTDRQLETIKHFYQGPGVHRDVFISPGLALGSEYGWGPYFRPENLADDHLNFLFYEKSPGMPMPGLSALTQKPDKKAVPPEYAWWEFNLDEYASGKGKFMMAITDATNPDLSRFLIRGGGKLVLYHGWADPSRQSMATVNYYRALVDATFGGDIKAAQEKARLFMVPGMGHCRGGPGLSEFDALPAVVDWVEKGIAPKWIVGQRRTDGIVDNRRPVCPYPDLAVYTGPLGGENNRANWIEGNFACR
jgi:feruloyl esterase